MALPRTFDPSRMLTCILCSAEAGARGHLCDVHRMEREQNGWEFCNGGCGKRLQQIHAYCWGCAKKHIEREMEKRAKPVSSPAPDPKAGHLTAVNTKARPRSAGAKREQQLYLQQMGILTEEDNGNHQ